MVVVKSVVLVVDSPHYLFSTFLFRGNSPVVGFRVRVRAGAYNRVQINRFVKLDQGLLDYTALGEMERYLSTAGDGG